MDLSLEVRKGMDFEVWIIAVSSAYIERWVVAELGFGMSEV